MFELIFLIAVSIYFIQSVLFSIGAARKFNKLPDEKLPTVTVIVAARNEERNILRCLESLDRLVYPEGKIEIIIVNDNSTDTTGELAGSFIGCKPRFRLINGTIQIGQLKGKANALANALKVASGEIILTTDADCSVSPLWAKSIASYYQSDVGMVCGYTSQISGSHFTGMQSLDFIYLLTVAAGSMNFNVPLSCIGNNMSYRKQAYDDVGGYESIPFSVTEDFKLLMSIYALKKYRIIYPLDEDALVVSKPCEDFRSLFWQKKRWGVGGLDSNFSGFAVMASGFIVHLSMLLTPIFFSVNALYLIAFKLITDLFFLFPVVNKLKIKEQLKYFAAFQLYFILYVLILPLILIPSRKIVWKDRRF